jgi:cyclohexadienyl dehydratase
MRLRLAWIALIAGAQCAAFAQDAAVAQGAAVTQGAAVAQDAVYAQDAHFSDEASRVDRVLELLDQRLSLMPAVAAWKWQHRAPVSDPAREQAVILAAGKLASPLGLASAPVERLFALQVRLARDAEAGLHTRWRRSGYDFSGRVPDLKQDLRPQLDHLTHDLLRALYLSAPAFARADFPDRYAAQAARLLASSGWSDASRRELLADLAGVRLEPVPPLERVAASHALRIGTTGDYAPFSSTSGDRLQGVDIELARALAQRLDAEPVFVHTSWARLLDDLLQNQFDVAVGGISATPARAAVAAVSVAYLPGGKTIIARCSDRSRFHSLSAVDRPGVRVIVNPGGTNEAYVRTHLNRAHVTVYPSNTTIFDELIAGRADVMITDDIEVELETHRHRELCRAFPGTLTRADKVILMSRDAALIAAVNGWLRRELAAGAPERLLRAALSE